METPYDNLAQIYTKCSVYMAIMPLYGKMPFFQNGKAYNRMTLYVKLSIVGAGPTKFARIMILG